MLTSKIKLARIKVNRPSSKQMDNYFVQFIMRKVKTFLSLYLKMATNLKKVKLCKGSIENMLKTIIDKANMPIWKKPFCKSNKEKCVEEILQKELLKIVSLLQNDKF